MLKYVTITVGLAALASTAGAQGVITAPRSGLLFTPWTDVAVGAKDPAPFPLRSDEEAARVQRVPKATTLAQMDCPMPVHHPDTLVVDRLTVGKPPANVSYSMPRADVKCFNPLDRAK
jgi:hypothetical protein